MAKKSGKEKRNWIRAKHVLSIQYRIAKAKRKKYDPTWGLSTTQDMSYGGLSFLSDRDIRVGDILELRVVMSGILDIYSGFTKVARVAQKKRGSHALIGVKYLDVKKNKDSKSEKGQKKTPKRSAKKYTAR
jgi:hypothetical protein